MLCIECNQPVVLDSVWTEIDVSKAAESKVNSKKLWSILCNTLVDNGTLKRCEEQDRDYEKSLVNVNMEHHAVINPMKDERGNCLLLMSSL